MKGKAVPSGISAWPVCLPVYRARTDITAPAAKRITRLLPSGSTAALIVRTKDGLHSTRLLTDLE